MVFRRLSFFQSGLRIAILLFAANLWALPAHAEGTLISKAAGRPLILTADNCPQLLKERDAICAWKKSINDRFVPATNSANTCTQNPNGSFSLSILDCLPEFAKQVIGLKLTHNGPNCWGTTLSFHGNSEKPRFVWPEEMLYWLESPVCRKLSPGEPMMPGDVINVFYPEHVFDASDLGADAGSNFWKVLYPNRYTPLRAPPSIQSTEYDGFLHSVTYISPDLAFGKDGPAADEPFYFHPLRMVYGRPRGLDESGLPTSNLECTENQTIVPYLREYQQPPNPTRRSKCFYFSNAYRCGNVIHQLATPPLESEDRLRLDKVRELQRSQGELFDLLFKTSGHLSAKKEASLTATAKGILRQDLEELKSNHLTKKKEMLLSLEYFSAAGILKTLTQLHEKLSN